MAELHPLRFLELAACRGSDQGSVEESGLFSLDVQLAVITTTMGSYEILYKY
jgi:hypothetical protein